MAGPASQPRLLHRWLWFVGLWAAGVATLAAVALLLRWVMPA